MGQEAICKAVCHGQTGEGRAHLDSAELQFKGDPLRFKIPFPQITELKAEKGVLYLSWPEGDAALHLGDQAEKWLLKIRYPKSVIDKLGVKEGMRVAVIGIDDTGFNADLDARTPDVSRTKPKKDSDLIFCRFDTPASLDRLPKLIEYLKPKGAIWTVFPKGRKDFGETAVRAFGRGAGLIDVKVVAFSETHSSLKWVVQRL